MKRSLPGGYELDDDPARIDLGVVWRYLSTEAYWGRERSREDVERQVRGASRVVGVYLGEVQVGFSRTVSDEERIAYLADVFVASAHRGRGLGTELVRFSVDEGPFAHVRWMLHTMDAHGLYERFGFGPPTDRYLERPPAAERDRSGPLA